MKRTLVGEHIVIDPEICHGVPTFRGSRVFVADVLEQVAKGMKWDDIVAEWDGSVTPEAIAESIRLAATIFLEHADDYELEPATA